jgi:hypothetical protein
MIAYFEIHDSILEHVSETDRLVTLRLSAFRNECDSLESDLDGNGGYQEIQIEIDGAALSRSSSHTPVWLLDGDFQADQHDGKPEDVVSAGCIPASLTWALGVRLKLEGMDEDNNEHVTVEIEGKSMKLIPLSAPDFS